MGQRAKRKELGAGSTEQGIRSGVLTVVVGPWLVVGFGSVGATDRSRSELVGFCLRPLISVLWAVVGPWSVVGCRLRVISYPVPSALLADNFDQRIYSDPATVLLPRFGPHRSECCISFPPESRHHRAAINDFVCNIPSPCARERV